MVRNSVNTVNLQTNLKFLLVRWIVFVLANLELSIKEGEGMAASLVLSPLCHYC